MANHSIGDFVDDFHAFNTGTLIFYVHDASFFEAEYNTIFFLNNKLIRVRIRLDF